MKIVKAKNYEELSLLAATAIATQIFEKPDSVLGLATGSSPIGAYQNLIKLHKEAQLSFAKVKTVNLDEYKGLSKDDKNSYAYFMNENLFDHIDIDKNNTHIPDGLATDCDGECDSYENLISSLGGIDLQLLGIGRNGHIGFNEPDNIFSSKTHCVQLKESTINANARFFDNDMSKVPTMAFTMGIKTIMHAARILVIANGKDKAEAVRNMVNGPITPEVPASILQCHCDAVLIADEDALSLTEGLK